MKLFRKKDQSTIPADLEPYTRRHDWREWVSRLAILVFIIVLIAAVAWAGMRVYQSVVNDDAAVTQKEDKKDGSKDSKNESKSKAATPQSPSTNQAPKTSTPSPQPVTMPKTGDDTTSQPATLPSTGG